MNQIALEECSEIRFTSYANPVEVSVKKLSPLDPYPVWWIEHSPKHDEPNGRISFRSCFQTFTGLNQEMLSVFVQTGQG